MTIVSLAAALAVGGIATLQGGFGAERPLTLLSPLTVGALGLVLLATGTNLMLRFVRWQYLLRRLDVRLATVPSLAAFAGSFAFLPIPLYAGQIVARTRLADGVEPSRRARVLLAAILERLLDAWAVAFLSLPWLPPLPRWIVLAALVVGLHARVRARGLRLTMQATDWFAALILVEPGPVDAPFLWRDGRGRVFAVTAGLSFLAWAPVVLGAAVLARAAGAEVPLLEASGAAAASILVGTFSLSPLGAGTSGLFLLDALQTLGASVTAAAFTVFTFRAATVWLTVAIGAGALFLRHRRSSRPTEHDHFDAIDHSYDAWLPPHFREHLVGKKVGAMATHVELPGSNLRGLDIGCGRGWYLRELRDLGATMTGFDLSRRQLAAARKYLGGDPDLVRGSVLALPFAPGRFDFAYVINVLHHLPSPEHQAQALREIAAVLKPGGTLFVHEMNVINPVFRLYLGYVFPILKGIEEGTEPYMDTRRMPRVDGLELTAVDYFTFIPDFAPAALLPRLAALEQRLERSGVRRYAAHFMAVFRRIPVDTRGPTA